MALCSQPDDLDNGALRSETLMSRHLELKADAEKSVAKVRGLIKAMLFMVAKKKHLFDNAP